LPNGKNVIIQDTLGALTSVLFPAPCRICGGALLNASRIPVCIACLESFKPIMDPMCRLCGRPFVSAVTSHAERPLCRLCRSNFYGFDLARSFADYNEQLTSAILLLKYEQVTRLGEWFAARLEEVMLRAPEYAQDRWRFDIIVPVPLHSDRKRERGYNQAELIAKPLAKRLGLKLAPQILVRTKPRPPQLVLSRTEHWKSVRGAYAIREGAQVDKLHVLLVDDVLTTGATLDACARVLKKAGAVSVVGLTVGRVAPTGWQPGSPVGAGPGGGKVANQD
jgi:ComF family protein